MGIFDNTFIVGLIIDRPPPPHVIVPKYIQLRDINNTCV